MPTASASATPRRSAGWTSWPFRRPIARSGSVPTPTAISRPPAATPVGASSTATTPTGRRSATPASSTASSPLARPSPR
ncbi:hypothetical protein G6F60_015281 [Rhizopus arrhizus]|nr:hypothetical protein G6F60_015281 [Rhizopus arrhizus]